MFKLFSLANRNVWRQRGRSLLTLGAVALAVFFALVYQGLIGAVENGMYNTLTAATGHLQVHAADYRERRRARDRLIGNAASVVAKLRTAAPEAESVVALELTALISGAQRSRGVQLIGMAQPARQARAFAAQYLQAGTMPDDNDPAGIALGAALARALQVRLGDEVRVSVPGGSGRGAGAYRVAALLHLPDPAAEARAAYLPLASAQALGAPGAATRLELHLPILHYSDDATVTALRPELASALGSGYSVETWREANPALAGVLGILEPLVLVIQLLFFVLAGLMVVNTVYLSLLERTREFGVIAALGAGPGTLTRLVLLESLMLCLSGALVGGVLGVSLVTALSGGFSYPGLGEVAGSFGIPETLYPSLNPGSIAVTLIFAVLTGILAALWPARVAARLQPVEAMRFTA